MLLVALTGCAAASGQPADRVSAAEPNANPNDVDADVLAPRLLDETSLAPYLAAFPHDQYRATAVPGLGKFYLDDLDDVIKNILREGRPWEPHIRKILARYARPSSTVVDAGAHIGTHSVDLGRRVGPRGRVYAFEPQKKIYRELVHNLRLNRIDNVVPLRFALGDRHGVIEMSPPSRGNEGHTWVGRGGDRAELRTIDSFGFANLSLLKIDVEGFEDAVLAGAEQTILAQRPAIVLELMGGHDVDTATREVQDHIAGSVARLQLMGYAVKRLVDHDYLALPADSTEPCPGSSAAVCTRRLGAGHGFWLTEVGTRDARRRTISSPGTAGMLQYGPYEVLPAGSYVARWYASVEAGGRVRMDAVNQRGTDAFGTAVVELGPSSEVKNIGLVAFTVPAPLAVDVEYRLYVHEGVRLTLSAVTIQRLVLE